LALFSRCDLFHFTLDSKFLAFFSAALDFCFFSSRKRRKGKNDIGRHYDQKRIIKKTTHEQLPNRQQYPKQHRRRRFFKAKKDVKII
jgi:hypothetical protein